jgi:hypothetical protein
MTIRSEFVVIIIKITALLTLVTTSFLAQISQIEGVIQGGNIAQCAEIAELNQRNITIFS